MGKIYVGQTAIEFEVDVATDVTGAVYPLKAIAFNTLVQTFPLVSTTNAVFCVDIDNPCNLTVPST